MVNITVLAAGSIYLGDMLEPITGTKNAEKNMNWGVPFTQRPKAVRYDYKVKMSGEERSYPVDRLQQEKVRWQGRIVR